MPCCEAPCLARCGPDERVTVGRGEWGEALVARAIVYTCNVGICVNDILCLVCVVRGFVLLGASEYYVHDTTWV